MREPSPGPVSRSRRAGHRVLPQRVARACDLARPVPMTRTPRRPHGPVYDPRRERLAFWTRPDDHRPMPIDRDALTPPPVPGDPRLRLDQSSAEEPNEALRLDRLLLELLGVLVLIPVLLLRLPRPSTALSLPHGLHVMGMEWRGFVRPLRPVRRGW